MWDISNVVISESNRPSERVIHRLVDERLIEAGELPQAPADWQEPGSTATFDPTTQSLSSLLLNWQARHPNAELQLLLGEQLPVEPSKVSLPEGTQLELQSLPGVDAPAESRFVPNQVIVLSSSNGSSENRTELSAQLNFYRNIVNLWQSYFKTRINFQVVEDLSSVQQSQTSDETQLLINLGNRLSAEELGSVQGFILIEAQERNLSQAELPSVTRTLLSEYQAKLHARAPALIDARELLSESSETDEAIIESHQGQLTYWLWLAIALLLLERVFSEWRLRREHG